MAGVQYRGAFCPASVPLCLLLATASFGARAFEIETGNPDLKVRWDNTFRYTASARVKERDPRVFGGAATGRTGAGATRDFNADDGDRNFSKGLISNRVDLFSELDISYQDVGMRVSGAAWYDSVYNRSNDNTSPASANKIDPSTYNQFSDGTRNQLGQGADLLDLFAFGKVLAESTPTTFRVGRYAQQWGESLFFASNGIAGGMAPTDIVKLLSIPTSTAKETTLPVAQAGGQVQLNDQVTLGAYYQFEWRPNRFPAVGSYFSTTDVVFPGAEAFLFGPARAPYSLVKAKDEGQFGLSAKWSPAQLDANFGLYAIRYHDKSPKIYLAPPTGFVKEVYGEGIRAYGGSMATNVGGAAVAGEISYRNNMPLVSPGQIVTGQSFDNSGNPAYAVGKSFHANLNAMYTVARSSWWDGGILMGELAFNRRLSVEKRPQALDPNSTRDAYSMRVVFSPQYLNILPGLDVSVPLGLGYTPRGSRSSVVSGFGAENGGDMSIGLSATYLQVWDARLAFVNYYGTPGPSPSPVNGLPGSLTTYYQTLWDRNFVSFSLRRTF